MLLVVYDHGSVAPLRLADVAERIGCRIVFVCSGSAHAVQMRPILAHVAGVVTGDDLPPGALVRRLREMRPAGITTFSEYQIGYTAWLAAELGLPYQDPSDIPAITTKAAQRERFRHRGLDSLRSMAVTSEEDADPALRHIGLPAMVKPDRGLSSRNTVAVRTEEEYHATVAAFLGGGDGQPPERRLVVEELLIGRKTAEPWGDYIAVDCVAEGGVVRPLFVTAKFALAEPFRERGGYGPPVLPAEEIHHVEDLAVRAVSALNFRQGVADVEIKLTDAGPRVIEVNGRLGGWVDDLAMRSGAPGAADAAMRSALSLPVDLTGGESRIAFHYVAIAPMWAQRVRAVPGLATLRGLDGVERVTPDVRPGSPLDWRGGTQTSKLAAITGVAASHDQLASLVGTFERLDWIELE
ncbi:ATP-grasp domain-containing protein [Micromonospora fluostatini]|uniref:ATP-grasp domain-containing protein n=1 Tax=Micromonospora sp. JCM 30529 TaxID=3421643 RepID=UPI003D1681B5